MTTRGSNLNTGVEIALFGERRECKVHAITVLTHGTWVRLRRWITKKIKRRTELVEDHGKTIMTVGLFEVSSNVTSTLRID